MSRPGIALLNLRTTLARQLAEGSQSGLRIKWRMMRNEVSWVRYCRITPPMQGQHQKVSCMLNDESVLLAVREYISQAGQSKLFLVQISIET